jgi:hypothetical protein
MSDDKTASQIIAIPYSGKIVQRRNVEVPAYVSDKVL